MTPQEFKSAQATLGLSAREMALALELGDPTGRAIRKWTSGEHRIPGPVAVALRMFVRHGLDRHARALLKSKSGE